MNTQLLFNVTQFSEYIGVRSFRCLANISDLVANISGLVMNISDFVANISDLAS